MAEMDGKGAEPMRVEAVRAIVHGDGADGRVRVRQLEGEPRVGCRINARGPDRLQVVVNGVRCVVVVVVVGGGGGGGRVDGWAERWHRVSVLRRRAEGLSRKERNFLFSSTLAPSPGTKPGLRPRRRVRALESPRQESLEALSWCANNWAATCARG